MESNTQEFNRITQLDGLRGIAAIMVLALHFPIENSFLTNNFFVRQSWLFVDFFFVLSGFIIGSNYFIKISEYSAFNDYIKKRFFRLFPLLFFTVILFFVYTSLGLMLGIKVNAAPINFYIMEAFDSLLFLNSTKLLGDTQGMNPPSWSISAEMISYFIFGLIMVLFKKISNQLFIGIIICSISFMIWNNDYAFQNGDFGFVRGLLGFMTGVITFIFSRKFIIKTSYFEILVLVMLIFAFYLTHQTQSDYNRVQYIFMPFLFSITIYVFLYSGGAISKLLKTRLFQFLGRISYSIYLNHYLIVSILMQIYLNILKLPAREPFSTIFFLLYVFITILISAFTYSIIEIQGSKLLKRLTMK